MQNKDGFLLYTEQITIFNKLTDEQAGKLIKAIYQYESTRKEPELDFGLDIAFTSIKIVLDKNREKYQKKCNKNKENADKRWKNNANAYEKMQTYANYADNDTDNDTDNDLNYHNDNNEDDSCVDDPSEFFKKNFNDNNDLSDYQKSKLDDFSKNIGNDLVLYAMKKCVDYKATNLKYLKSIINNWQKLNVTTVEEAEKIDQEFQKNKKSSPKEFEYQKDEPNNLDGLYEN